ncbi:MULTISPECIES: hypothetical protein [Mycolicibacterium]|uniref:Transmembrane protein n=2 Tax=Mycolicibacterium TaxID=1866885 RepID=A0ABR5FM57_9MYCO|nr:hypothetical protein [Mycolicibacterium senegalense]KLI09220.1 hypothetical protein AA982_03655 [Mycolicibacterium senegalense]KLO47613.1 hypothetical protein ABW05_30675 [Mycolicibacterium senegalense]
MAALISRSILQRMTLAGALTAGVGGATTTALPGLSHWPAPSVIVTVAAITILGGLIRKVLLVATVAVLLTVALVAVDAATGQHIQQALNPAAALRMVGQP